MCYQLLFKLDTGLELNKVSTHTVDTASVLTQKDVYAANCLAHILHDAAKYAAGKRTLMLKTLCLKSND